MVVSLVVLNTSQRSEKLGSDSNLDQLTTGRINPFQFSENMRIKQHEPCEPLRKGEERANVVGLLPDGRHEGDVMVGLE